MGREWGVSVMRFILALILLMIVMGSGQAQDDSAKGRN
jgi:hypothetical protein